MSHMNPESPDGSPALTVYKASAGSGKTFTLAVQYIKRLVLADEDGEYARILAVTFTNKATTEMKDRILSQLYGIGNKLKDSDVYLSELKKSIQEEVKGEIFPDDEIRRRCRMALHQILHDYNRFRVQTIDAFFQTVLRGLAHELGLTANLQVEISDTEVLSKAVDSIVDRLQDEPQVFEWLYSLVRDRIASDQRWDVTREVKNFGRAIFNEDYLMRGEQLRERLSDTRFVREYIRQLQDMEAGALEMLKNSGVRIEQAVYDSGVTYADFSNGQTLRSFVERLKSGDINIDTGARIVAWADDPMTLLKKTDQKQRPELLPVADEISGLLDATLQNLPKMQYTVNSVRLAQTHIKPLCLLDAIDREVSEINAETSRFNLAKTPILLSRMVGESDPPFVFEKIGAMLRHVMIDEFQDTSRLQWKNFQVLLLESIAKGGRNLLVGDVKQSIYRWRGGDWRILGDIERSVIPMPIVKNLNVNRRSSAAIVHFNNEFFQEAAKQMDAVSADEEYLLRGTFSFKDAYADVVQKTPADLEQSIGAASLDSDAGFVSLTLLDSREYKKREDWQPAILEDLKQQVRTLHHDGLSYAQMTILVRNNADMLPVIESFAEDPDLPPIVSDEAFLLASSPAVRLLISALRVLDDPNDCVSAYYLRKQVEDLPADGLDPLLARLPLYELLETLYQKFHLDSLVHQDAYLFGFFDAVLDFLHGEAADIHSFLSYWDERLSRQSIPAGLINGIRIISIHKAKGLEFHTVFMPFCTWAFERDRNTDLLWCTPTEEPFRQLQLIPITPNARLASHSVFSYDYAESHLLSRLDELNALYVGFTRAVDNFYAWSVGNAENLSKSSRTVGDLIASVVPGGCVIGDPVVKVDKHKASDNRMTPERQSVNISMHSYPLSASFRQSNRSRQFLASLSSGSSEIEESEYYRQQQYVETGLMLHGILQQIHTIDDVPRVLDALEHDGVISRYAPDGTYVSVRRRDIEQWFGRGFSSPCVMSWFSDGWNLFNECSIVSLNPQSNQPETHRPDRVLVSKDGRQVVVVDFKFGRPAPDYETQVRDYMHLLSGMYSTARVEGFLWYVYTNRITSVSFSPNTPVSSSLDAAQLSLDF